MYGKHAIHIAILPCCEHSPDGNDLQVPSCLMYCKLAIHIAILLACNMYCMQYCNGWGRSVQSVPS